MMSTLGLVGGGGAGSAADEQSRRIPASSHCSCGVVELGTPVNVVVTVDVLVDNAVVLRIDDWPVVIDVERSAGVTTSRSPQAPAMRPIETTVTNAPRTVVV